MKNKFEPIALDIETLRAAYLEAWHAFDRQPTPRHAEELSDAALEAWNNGEIGEDSMESVRVILAEFNRPNLLWPADIDDYTDHS